MGAIEIPLLIILLLTNWNTNHVFWATALIAKSYIPTNGGEEMSFSYHTVSMHDHFCFNALLKHLLHLINLQQKHCSCTNHHQLLGVLTYRAWWHNFPHPHPHPPKKFKQNDRMVPSPSKPRCCQTIENAKQLLHLILSTCPEPHKTWVWWVCSRAENGVI